MSLIRLLVDGVSADDFPALDQRAFQYGDGVFETIPVVNGRLCLWGYHLERLWEGCRRLGLPQPDTRVLEREVESVCDQTNSAVLKLYWTAGTSERGYRRPAPLVPLRVLALYDAPIANDRERWCIRTCRYRLGDNPALAGVKHLNRLDQVIARAEWDDPQIDEGLMCAQDGTLVGGTMTNLIVEKDGLLSTPVLDRTGIAGVVRRLVIETAAAAQQALRVCRHTMDDLSAADALYLTNAVVGVRRVERWDEVQFDQSLVEHPVMQLVRQRCHDPNWNPGSML